MSRLVSVTLCTSVWLIAWLIGSLMMRTWGLGVVSGLWRDCMLQDMNKAAAVQGMSGSRSRRLTLLLLLLLWQYKKPVTD